MLVSLRATLFAVSLAACLISIAGAAPLQFETPADSSRTITPGPGPTGAGTTQPAPALDDSFWKRATLTGSWDGFRDQLKDHGITVTPVLQTEYFGNTGGADQGHIVDGLINIALDLDLEHLTGFWHDAVLHANGLYIYGPDLSGRYVGDFSVTSSIAGYNSVRLQELWLQQTFWEKRASVKIGMIAADTEFFGSQASSLFINGTFGAFTLFANNFANAPVYPVANPGIRLDVAPTPSFDFKAAIFSDNSLSDPARNNRHGTYLDIRSRDGVLGVVEASYLLNQSPDDHGLIGSYRLGAFIQNGAYTTFYSQALDALGTGHLSSSGTNFAIYGVADQEVYKKDGKVVSLFARGGYAPPKYSFVAGYIDAGVNFTGFVPGRTQDVAGFALARSNISHEFSAASEAIGKGEQTSESVLEATYRVVLAPWWTVQPDLQYLFNPGGAKGSHDAFVFGVRTSVTF